MPIPFRIRCIAIIVLFLLTSFSFSQTNTYSIEDISPNTVGNPNISYFPKKINDSGYITGFKYSLGGSTISQFWFDGNELPAGNTNSVAYDISNSNIIVGRGLFASFDTRGYTFSPSSQNYFWLPCPLFTQYGTFCEAYGVNESGLVVGTSDPRSLYPQSNEAVSRALLWDSTVAAEIFPGSGLVSVANDINNYDTIVGMRNYEPFVKTSSGTLTLLGGLSNTGSLGQMVFAQAINDRGHVIGGHTLNAEGLVQRAFFWDGMSRSI